MKKLIYLSLSVLFLTLTGIPLKAQKSSMSVSGTISSNTTWTGIDTVLVTGNVTISDGITLTIDPGICVVFQGHYRIGVSGRLLAIGTETDTIVFTVSDTSGYHNHSHTGWAGIRIWNTNSSNDSTKLVYCRLEYGKDVDTDRGGAILITGFKKLLVDYCELRYNYASLKGGAIFIWNGGGATINNCYFHHNRTGYDGGAFFSWNSFVISNSKFTDNYAGSSGGAINVLQGSFTLVNNVICNNHAEYGGGIYTQNSINSKLLNNTVCDNHASTGGGLYIENQSPVFRNTILFGNTANSGKQVYIEQNWYQTNFYYCDIDGGQAGIGGYGPINDWVNCIEIDPMFLNTGDHPYNIQSTSLCLNGGDPATTIAEAGPYDIAGMPRIYDGYEDIIDIGAYEYQGDPKPSIISLYPPDDSKILEKDPILTIIFSALITAETGNITIHNEDGTVFEQITASNTALVTIDSKTVSINPVNDFIFGSNYYILIDSLSFSHVNGQKFSGFYSSESWDFGIGEIYGSAGTTLNFDGSDDYVEIADDDSLDLTMNYTIEAWIKPASFGHLDGIISKYQSSGAHGYYLRFLSASPYSGISFDGMSTASGILTTGEWYHIVGVNDNGTRKLYINGEKQSLTGTANTVLKNNNPVRIGVDYSSRYFHGDIDEVRIWNVPLSLEEVRSGIHLPLSGTEPGLVSYFQFNEEEGSKTHDYISGFIGTLNHMENNDWIRATMPFGAGMGNAQTVSATGNVIFTETGFSADFTAKNGTDTIYVARIDTIPDKTPATVDTVYDSQYWVVNKFGNGTFTANLSFTVAEDLTVDDQNNPSNVRLYNRSAFGSGGWTLVTPATSVDATSNTATFNDITSFGQFILGRHEGTTPFLVTDLVPDDNGSFIYNHNLHVTFNEVASEVSGKSIK
ncbi:MAG: Ig-like domain-containing protein, partial [Bacteroidales bacterium]|nr:Ig-like domain-containing protein [Bacteroidales bacterium]